MAFFYRALYSPHFIAAQRNTDDIWGEKSKVEESKFYNVFTQMYFSEWGGILEATSLLKFLAENQKEDDKDKPGEEKESSITQWKILLGTL